MAVGARSQVGMGPRTPEASKEKLESRGLDLPTSVASAKVHFGSLPDGFDAAPRRCVVLATAPSQTPAEIPPAVFGDPRGERELAAVRNVRVDCWI